MKAGAHILIVHRPPARYAKRGMTLAEVAIVMAVSAILLGCIVGLLAAIQRYDVGFREHGLHSEQLSRLAENIRTDVRQASAVFSLPGDAGVATMLVIDTARGEQVRYELDREGCRRFIGPPNVTTSTELFRVGPLTSWQVETGPPGRLPMYIISLQSKAVVDGEPTKAPLLVQAALGADIPRGAIQ